METHDGKNKKNRNFLSKNRKINATLMEKDIVSSHCDNNISLFNNRF